MQVEATITNIVTISTDVGAKRANQPMIEVTLNIIKEGEAKSEEIKFTEMLSNIANLTEAELTEHFSNIVAEYARTALAGQALLDKQKEWVGKDKFIGTKYIITV